MSFYQIIFDNSEIVVADKPAGWLTTPSRFEKDDERQVLGRILEKDLKARLFPVHRLDFEVSGLVLFAKTAVAQKIFNELFERRRIQKTYQALTEEQDFGHWPQNLPRCQDVINFDEPMIWQCRIQRGKRRSFVSAHGDASETVVQFAGPRADLLEWKIRPHTGRSHQIRLEMSRHGFPILGDELYGSKKTFRPNEIALRAVRLELENELKGIPKEFVVGGLSS